MTDSIEREVAELRREAESSRLAMQRAEAQAESAEADYQRVLSKLREEFGVDSVEEAESLLVKIDAELVSEIAAVRAALGRTPRPEESS